MTDHQVQLIERYRRWAELAPDWLRPLIEGRIFNVEQWHRFPANEVYLDLPGGGRSIVDSYSPNDVVVSRKNTLLGEVQPATARAYIDEVVKKYSSEDGSGIVIADTRGNRANPAISGRIGMGLRGDMHLEIPVANRDVPIPQEILDYADARDVTIVDPEGHVYNP